MTAQVILLGGFKRGTGKTTLATNLAVDLGNAGKKVLLIDLATNRHATQHAAKRRRRSIGIPYTMLACLENFEGNEEILVKRAEDTAEKTALILGESEKRMFVNATDNPIDAYRDEYDYIIVDPCITEEGTQLDIAYIADIILVPTLSIAGIGENLFNVDLGKSLNNIRRMNSDCRIFTIVNHINNQSERIKERQTIFTTLEAVKSGACIETDIPFSSSFLTSWESGRSVLEINEDVAAIASISSIYASLGVL